MKIDISDEKMWELIETGVVSFSDRERELWKATYVLSQEAGRMRKRMSAYSKNLEELRARLEEIEKEIETITTKDYINGFLEDKSV